MGILPHPINNLFVLNSERLYYNTKQTHDLQINAGRGGIVYKLFSYHSVHIWNYISKNNPIDVSYACFNNLTKPTYKPMIFSIEQDEIPYKMLSKELYKSSYPYTIQSILQFPH